MITQQLGNFFIMDSEQLVSNPYHEMQGEASGDYGKRSSQMEKFTSVKNNVCENHYSLEKAQLEREKENRLRSLHENASRLRYEVKLLDLNRRKNEIEQRKRVEPRRDFSFDDTQLRKTEKRLGANIESHYLDKKLRYPVRAKTTADLVVTPVVAQARTSLRDKRKRPESERVTTAKSMSSSITADSTLRESRFRNKWPSSRSAPLTASSGSSRFAVSNRDSRLPDIRKHLEQQSNDDKRSIPQRVKFAFESPHKLIVSENKARSLNPHDFMFRSHTYHEGMGRRPTFAYDSASDNENDDDGPYERVDLRALLFGKSKDEDTMSVKSHPHSVGTFTSHIGTGVRRSQGAPQQHTQEKLRKETRVIQGKIDAFLHRLETDPPIKKMIFQEDSESEEEMIEDENHTIPIFLRKKHPPTPKVEEQKKEDVKKEELKKEERKEEIGDEEDDISDDEDSQTQEKIPVKDGWKYIRGRDKDNNLRGTYSAADLVLQQLTGVLVGSSKRHTVPLHCASRAMRHTATFKMRKVVEALIESRTRYEQHEVDELKKKIEGEVEVAPSVTMSDMTQQEVA